MTTHTATVHPRFATYADSAREPGVLVDFVGVDSHQGKDGTFSIDPIHSAQGWKIVNSAVPDARETAGHDALEIFVKELPDAQFVCDLLNLAVSHVREDEETAHV